MEKVFTYCTQGFFQIDLEGVIRSPFTPQPFYPFEILVFARVLVALLYYEIHRSLKRRYDVASPMSSRASSVVTRTCMNTRVVFLAVPGSTSRSNLNIIPHTNAASFSTTCVAVPTKNVPFKRICAEVDICSHLHLSIVHVRYSVILLNDGVFPWIHNFAREILATLWTPVSLAKRHQFPCPPSA